MLPGEVMESLPQHSQSEKAAIMLDFNSLQSRLTDFFEFSFAKLDGQIVVKQSYSQGDADYRGQLMLSKRLTPMCLHSVTMASGDHSQTAASSD